MEQATTFKNPHLINRREFIELMIKYDPDEPSNYYGISDDSIEFMWANIGSFLNMLRKTNMTFKIEVKGKKISCELEYLTLDLSKWTEVLEDATKTGEITNEEAKFLDEMLNSIPLNNESFVKAREGGTL